MRRDWRTLKAFLADCKGLQIPSMLRLFLALDGSTTRSLNSLFLTPITLELIRQHEVIIEQSLSSQLGIPSGEKGIERAVWLKTVFPDHSVSFQKLLHAVSIFPNSGFQPELYHALQVGQKPLGQIVDERGLATYRDHFEVAHLPFPKVADGLALKEDTLFWARRYRLSIPAQGSALIQEVFSPGLVSFLS